MTGKMVFTSGYSYGPAMNKSPAEILAATLPRRNKRRASTPKRKVCWVCKLLEMRESLGLSQQEVRDAVGLSGSGYCDIERGTDPQLTTAKKLADFFGKSVEDIWTREK